MKLKELIKRLTVVEMQGDMEVDITGINMNSKHLTPGELFVCIPGIPGLQEDRHHYIDDAIKAGAAAIVVERDGVAAQSTVPTIKVSNDSLTHVVKRAQGTRKSGNNETVMPQFGHNQR